MSLEGRLKQGLTAIADNIDVDYELGLVRVQAVARQRERRNVMIAALAGAAAAALLLIAGPRLADTVLGLEIRKPFQPAVPDREQDGTERDDKAPELDPDDVRNAERIGRQRDLQADAGLRPTAAGGFNRLGGSRSGSQSSGDRSTGGNPAPVGGPTRNHIDEPRDRTTSGNYQAAGVDAAAQYNCPSDPGDDVGCVEFVAKDYERYLSLNVSDTSGKAVAVVVGIDANRNGKVEDNFEICGSTDGFVEIPAGARIEIQLFADNESCGTGNGPTRGSVTATFSDRLA